MAGGFHIYYEAAEALWDMPNHRLEEMARGDGAPGRRRAASKTLRLKAEYVSPEVFGNERSSISKLAGVLSDDPAFTMDMALRIGGSARQRSRKTVLQAGVVIPSGRSRTMWLAITAGVILLMMDVLATAGVPIPTPIGMVIDQFAGADESPVSPPPPAPAPRPRKGTRGSIIGDGGDYYALPRSHSRAAGNARRDEAPAREVSNESSPVDAPEKAPALGRGRELHQARGRELHQAQGRELHQPDHRGNSKAKSPPGQVRSNSKGQSGK
jgi:hypothetical protein